MVAIATGLWWDYSKSTASAATLTLSMTSSNFLLSALAFLVTLAGASAWSITAFILHSIKTSHGSESAHAIDLMHQVSLRNSGGAISTVWETLKIHLAWSKSHKHPHLLRKTSFVAVPAILVWAGFAVAAIFTSSVANKAYGSTIARIKDQNCGFWTFDTTTDEGNAAALTRNTNDTIAARSYVNSFYANTSSASTAQSLFVKSALPYTTSSSAPCPIPDTKRCRGGANSAFSVTTDLLNSHTMLGINAAPEDQVELRMKVTCSPAGVGSFSQVSEVNDTAFVDFYLGPLITGNNVTYRHKVDTQRSGIGYMITTRFAYAGGGGSVWKPIPEFSRDDADVSIYFLSSNAVSYLTPVNDPWFSANGNNTVPYGDDRNAWQYDYLVNPLVCAEQYQICNPSTAACSPLAGYAQVRSHILSENKLGLNSNQFLTATRIVIALINANTFHVVGNIGIAALWANSKLFNNIISMGLPPNQWQIEVLGWFQTALAMVQSYIVAFASNDNGLTPFATPATNTALRTVFDNANAYEKQCKGQLVQTAGEVQNFSLVGVLVIICVSVFLIFLQLAIEPLVDLVKLRSGWQSASKKARQADSKHHLLRMALAATNQGDATWKRGTLDVPVLEQDAVVERPSVTEKLSSYSVAPKVTDVTHVSEPKADTTV